MYSNVVSSAYKTVKPRVCVCGGEKAERVSNSDSTPN